VAAPCDRRRHIDVSAIDLNARMATPLARTYHVRGPRPPVRSKPNSGSVEQRQMLLREQTSEFSPSA
jgi:hypothetical protein